MRRFVSLDLLLEVHLPRASAPRRASPPCAISFAASTIGLSGPNAAGDELADPARPDHVVAEELDSAFRSRSVSVGSSGVASWCRKLMRSRAGSCALGVQRDERLVHRVVVFGRRAIARHVRRLERALIEVRGHAEAQSVRHRVDARRASAARRSAASGGGTASRARSPCAPPAMAPSSPTGIGGVWLSKIFLPALFVTDGPLNAFAEMYTGWFDTAASSSAASGAAAFRLAARAGCDGIRRSS